MSKDRAGRPSFDLGQERADPYAAIGAGEIDALESIQKAGGAVV
nr:hypothetical protein [Brevundimonas subvibrioides]